MIEVRGVSKRFGSFVALDDVTLALPGGSLAALLGPSGSGKSTLLRVIAGLERPDQGSVHIDGVDASATPPQRRGVGFVFQHYAAFKHMTVWENVAFGLKVRRRPRDETRRRVAELLELVQLEGFAGRHPAQLSGGQRQRMALARALAVAPRVLLLDEPFGALDARVRAELRGWLRRLHDELSVTTVFVTHDQQEAMEVADLVAVLQAGRVEQVASPREVYERPATEFVMRFVGPVNQLGEALVRPHDVELLAEPADGAVASTIERVTHLGFEARVELVAPGRERLWAQVTSDEAELRELRRGQVVYARPQRTRVFGTAGNGGRPPGGAVGGAALSAAPMPPGRSRAS